MCVWGEQPDLYWSTDVWFERMSEQTNRASPWVAHTQSEEETGQTTHGTGQTVRRCKP